MKSIEFVKQKEDSIMIVKEKISQIGAKVIEEKEINNGCGYKLNIEHSKEFASIIIYFKGKNSSKIIIEKATQDFENIFCSNLELKVIKPDGVENRIPVSASIKIQDTEIQKIIKESIENTFQIEKLEKHEHQEFIYKITYYDFSCVVTLYKSGNLVVQGIYSDLIDKVAEIINAYKPLDDMERALFYVSAKEKNKIEKEIKENSEMLLKMNERVKNFPEGFEDYLFENDKKTYSTGLALVEIIKKVSEKLDEYNFLVAQFAKVYEGFIIKIMIEKDFFTIEDYKKNPEIADVGNALRKLKFKKYITDERRYGYVLEKMIAIWEGSRCKEMHSDPLGDRRIICIQNPEEAFDKVGEIKACMRDAYNILIRAGLTDEDICQTKKDETYKSEEKDLLVVQNVEKDSNQINKEKEEKFLSFTKESHIGTDESGKGDYLGAIVIAGVYVDKETNEKLKSLGVKDSKTISDSKIKEMAPEIRRLVGEDKYSVIKINPEKYNELYDKMKNMNELLAWGHARAIENLLIKNDCTAAIADQFGNEEYINKALMENGKKIELLQIHKAERDIAVAAASILAREGFLTSIEAMGIKYGITIPKGANETVIKVTKSIIEKNGEGELTKIAKLNFKTTQQVIKN